MHNFPFADASAVLSADLILSVDNALAIGLAASQLSAADRHRAVRWGGILALIIRAAATALASLSQAVPGLGSLAGAGLAWIAWSLIRAHRGQPPSQPARLGSATRAIVLANLALSLDNIVADAALSGGRLTPLLVGLALSGLVLVFGALWVARLAERWPAVQVVGGVALGWIGASLVVRDLTGLGWLPLIPSLPWTGGAVTSVALWLGSLAVGRAPSAGELSDKDLARRS